MADEGLPVARPARRHPPLRVRARPTPGEPPEGIAIGNPEQIIRELKKWEATGVDLVNFILNANEQIPQEQVLESLRLFGRDVMPAFDEVGAPAMPRSGSPRRRRHAAGDVPDAHALDAPVVGDARRPVPADQLGGRGRAAR